MGVFVFFQHVLTLVVTSITIKDKIIPKLGGYHGSKKEKIPTWVAMKWKGNTRGFDEFKAFIKGKLLPILGIKSENPRISDMVSQERITVSLDRDGKYQADFSSGTHAVYIDSVPTKLTDFTINMGAAIIDAFLEISCFYVDSNKIRNRYPDEITYEKVVDTAIENGICRYIAGANFEKFIWLVSSLEIWAVKTYEGKKVNFGFIFDPEREGGFLLGEGKSWLDFLQNDYAAPLSDGIHSLIELNKNCEPCGYLSLTEGGRVSGYKLEDDAPLRFAQVIQTHVTGNRVGIFLLNNGDIVLAKDRAVRVIKRNLKWLNISFEAFSGFITAELSKKLSEKLLKSIYASVLDVSFSHTGGIIAWVQSAEKWNELTVSEAGREAIIDPCDDLHTSVDDDAIIEMMKKVRGKMQGKEEKEFEKEIEMRLLKRKVVKALVDDKPFSKMDRKLRAELIAMDGACVVDWKGRVCAVGAIIQNDSGSAGGGRTAAAKKCPSAALRSRSPQTATLKLL